MKDRDTFALFDSHCHLNAETFDGRHDEVIQAAQEAGVAYMAVVGFDYETINRGIRLAEAYDNIILALGWHPTQASSFDDQAKDFLKDKLGHPKVHMLGEIGLDYYWDTATPRDQEAAFRYQIQLAKDLNLPITIHNREATEDVYQILSQEGLPARGGIMHSFGGSPDQVQPFIDLGMHISFSGVVTFKKTDQVRQASRLVPADRLLIETDSPYLAPVPYRGKENQPAYVLEVAKVLAQVRGVPVEEIARQTTQNAFDLFGWYPSHGE